MKNKLLMALLCATAISSVSFAAETPVASPAAKASPAKEDQGFIDYVNKSGPTTEKFRAKFIEAKKSNHDLTFYDFIKNDKLAISFERKAYKKHLIANANSPVTTTDDDLGLGGTVHAKMGGQGSTAAAAAAMADSTNNTPAHQGAAASMPTQGRVDAIFGDDTSTRSRSNSTDSSYSNESFESEHEFQQPQRRSSVYINALEDAIKARLVLRDDAALKLQKSLRDKIERKENQEALGNLSFQKALKLAEEEQLNKAVARGDLKVFTEKGMSDEQATEALRKTIKAELEDEISRGLRYNRDSNRDENQELRELIPALPIYTAKERGEHFATHIIDRHNKGYDRDPDVAAAAGMSRVGIHSKANINPAHIGYEFGNLNLLHAYLSESREHGRAIAKMEPNSDDFKEYVIAKGMVHAHPDTHR